jgi:hypothetical protein
MLLSMTSTDDATTSKLTAVGFAGEGKVDDLIITTEDPDTPASTGVDFTLALGEGVSAVTWTIAEGGATIYKTEKYTGIEPGTYTITNVEYADWYAAAGSYGEGSTITVADGQTVTVSAKPVTAADVDVTVPDGTPDETVNAALAWAKAAGKTTTDVKAAANIINNYLLNVADLSKEPQIKIVEIDVSGEVPVVKAEVTEADGTTTIKELKSDAINGTIKYKTAAELKDLKTATPKAAIEDGDKFIQVVVE